MVLLGPEARTLVTELQRERRRLISAIMDALEALCGEELVTIVTRDDDGVLTPWTLFEGADLLSDKLNGWMDNTPWNAPKSL